MSPRIHQVLRGGRVKYFMGETLRADRASDIAVAESTVSDSKLCVCRGFRCTLSGRESRAEPRFGKILIEFAQIFAHVHPAAAGCGLEMGGYMLGKARVRNGRTGIFVLG